MLGGASLYNRQILSTGLIGVTFKQAGAETDLMKKVGIQWQQGTLNGYGTVSYVSYMNDTNFDQLLQEIHFK